MLHNGKAMKNHEQMDDLGVPIFRNLNSFQYVSNARHYQNCPRCLKFLDFLVSMLVKLHENFNGKGFHQFENDALLARQFARPFLG